MKTLIEAARQAAFRAVREEREKQVEQFPPEVDIQQVETSLLDTAGLLTAYIGKISDQGIEQRAGRIVDHVEVAKNFTIVAAIAVAMTEALLAKGDVQPRDLRD